MIFIKENTIPFPQILSRACDKNLVEPIETEFVERAKDVDVAVALFESTEYHYLLLD